MRTETNSEQILSGEAAALLSTLLDEALQQGGSTDASKFRAHHYDKIDAIEWLEAQGHVKRVNERYIATASALTMLETTTARHLLANAERIYGRVREHYKAAQAQRVDVEALAREANVPLDETRTALSFMLDMALWCGGWTTNLADPGAYIVPAEGVLKYPTFAAIIDQVREWRSPHHARAPMGLINTALAAPEGFATASMVRHETPRPDWLNSLQEPLREVMDEVYHGVDLDLRAISAMGIRAIIDMVLVDLVGDVGGFEKKLNQMVAKGLLTEMSRAHMLAAIGAGNAAAHRGHIPDRVDVLTLLRICENLLYERLVMPGLALRLRANTPARAKP
jgi:hypothetical protein